MIIEDWEGTYEAQAVWMEGPSADEIREKIKNQMPAYQLKTGLEGGIIIKPRQVLYVEVKGITSALITAQNLAESVRSAGGIDPIPKVNGVDLPELARRFSIGIITAKTKAGKSWFKGHTLAAIQKELEKTLQL